MTTLARLTQAWLRTSGPALRGHLARGMYGAKNVRIGRNFRCDGVPRCLIDSGAELVIEDDVEFRSGIEIRAHGKSRVVIERGARIDRGVRILAANAAEVRIEAGARIGLYAVLNGGDSIRVGRNALVSGFVYLQTSMHRFSQEGIPIRDQGYDHGPVGIGDGAWLAAHVVIMPGLTVGSGAIVGSNAVVTRDVAANEVVAGVPAKRIHIRSGEHTAA